MNDQKLSRGAWALACIRLFPSVIGDSVLSDVEFRKKYGFNFDAQVSFRARKLSFTRSSLYAAIRAQYREEVSVRVPSRISDTEWAAHLDQANKLQLIRSEEHFQLPDHGILSSRKEDREGWLEKELNQFWMDERSIDRWRHKVDEGEIPDDEFDELLEDLRCTPEALSKAIASELRSSELDISILIPSKQSYYERLVGTYVGDGGLSVAVRSSISDCINGLLNRNEAEGLKRALLMCSHSSVSDLLAGADIDDATITGLSDWLIHSADRISQVGAAEVCLARLGQSSNFEPLILSIVKTIVADDPEDGDGRFQLLSNLFILVEGELSRNQVLHDKPPFWRRLAAFAHASLIERQIILAGTSARLFADWVLYGAGLRFYTQTLVDMRREPRWLPDFASPKQLKAEAISRLAAAANLNRDKIESSELQDLLFGSGPGKLQSNRSLTAYFPGPLEGEGPPVSEMPAEMEVEILRKLEEPSLTVNSFIGLINVAILFRIKSDLADHASQALKRVKYQLIGIESSEQAYLFLGGLAEVAAVARHKELAADVQILSRIFRRRSDIGIDMTNLVRIGLLAASWTSDQISWRKFLGEWLTELAFEDIQKEDASRLNESMRELCRIEPSMWSSCSRAIAACKAFTAVSHP